MFKLRRNQTGRMWDVGCLPHLMETWDPCLVLSYLRSLPHKLKINVSKARYAMLKRKQLTVNSSVSEKSPVHSSLPRCRLSHARLLWLLAFGGEKGTDKQSPGMSRDERVTAFQLSCGTHCRVFLWNIRSTNKTHWPKPAWIWSLVNVCPCSQSFISVTLIPYCELLMHINGCKRRLGFNLNVINQKQLRAN